MIPSSSRLKLSQKLIAITFLPLLVTIVSILFYVFYSQDNILRKPVPLTLVLALPVGYFLIILFFIKKLTASIVAVKNAVLDMSHGKPAAAIPVTRNDEVATIAGAMNMLSQDLRSKTEFAGQISAGNLDALYQPVNGTDELGHFLLAMRDNLIRVKEEDQRRKWATESLAGFMEVLRVHKDLKALSNDIIINLVQIVKANQGAIFIANKETTGEEYLDMQACYAYKRTKHLTKRIAVGDGIVGQVFLEKRTTYLKKVPHDFVRITSGLGDENPRCVLIVPLKVEEAVVGVLELASFKTFEGHEIAFVEKISESIAHTILSFRTTEHTKKLLEESQAQAQQMRSQEEELRQNQEELQATQEEISRKYNALFKQLTELNHSSRFDQLRSITSTKKRNIEYYFDIIRNQILTFSEDRMIIEAIKAFRRAVDTIGRQVSAQELSMMRGDLKKYYEHEFMPRLNDVTDHALPADHFLPQQPATVVLQHLYISGNPFPTGKKSLLNDANDGSEYSKAHAAFHPILRNFLEKFGYYDVFLLDGATGDMLYSVFKEVDFATNLATGLYHTTNFGRLVQEAMASDDEGFVRLVDFEPYDPSYRAPASFIACPVYDGGHKIGILVFQMPINKINQILTGDNKWKEDGLGESGETLIVGNDYKLRTVSRELVENEEGYLSSLEKNGYGDDVIRQVRKTGTSILLERLQLESVSKALNGITNTQIEINSRGIATLNAFAPLNIPDVRWIILSSMKEEEVSQRINNLRITL